MTRRFGWWIIGTAIGISPLAGCAQWGRSYCAAVSEHPVPKKSFVPFPAADSPPAPSSRVVEASPLPTPVPPVQPLILPRAEAVDSTTVLPPLIAPLSTALEDSNPPVLPPVETTRPVPLVEAFRCMIEGRHGEALHYLQEYSAPTQEMYLILFPIMEIMAKKGIEQLSPPEADVVNLGLQKTSDALKPRSSLVIEKAFFCTSIQSFGRYQRLPEGYAFVAREWVRLYVEFRNLAGEPRSEGYWTSLRSTVEIRDQNNVTVWKKPRFEDERPIRSESFLHDYCVPYGFYIPPLSPGTYTLVIEVIDMTRPDQPRKAEKALEFRVTHTSARMHY